MTTLNAKLKEMDKQLDRIVKEMKAAGVPGMSVGFTDLVLRPAYGLLVAAQENRTPIPDTEEAIVATISSLVFDYLQRIHKKEELLAARDNFRLIGQDVSERIEAQIREHFTNGQLINVNGDKLNG